MLAVNLSDMAAMGAKPRWVLLSAALPELNQDWLKRFCDSFFALAARFDTVLIGGDTTKGDLVFNVTIVGEVPTGRALRRDAAEVGDDMLVCGSVGCAAALNKHLGHYQLPSESWRFAMINCSVRNRAFHWVRHCCRLPMPRKMFQTAWLKMWGIF